MCKNEAKTGINNKLAQKIGRKTEILNISKTRANSKKPIAGLKYIYSFLYFIKKYNLIKSQIALIQYLDESKDFTYQRNASWYAGI